MPSCPNLSKNILVVEDDGATREALALVLEADGHQATRAANGHEALELLRQGPLPDLILLDLMMPVLDGWQFRRRQQDDTALAPIPVVVLSAAADLARRAGPLGAVALLQKPVEPDRLLGAIRPFVARQRPGETTTSARECSGRDGPATAGPWWDGGSLSPETREPLALVLRSRGEVPDVLEKVTSAMTGEGFLPKEVFAMRLSLDEALVNALEHGHQGDPNKRVRVRYRVTAEDALVEVEDEGPGFDPASVPDPLSAEGRQRPSGRGLLLMRHFLSSVRHNERGNAVTLCQRRSGPQAEGRGP
jgi:serine/threonine-protein kinase RsbW